MKKVDKRVVEAFFALLNSGLWERDLELAALDEVDFKALFKLADEQAVIGLVTAGLDNLKGVKVENDDVLPFLKEAMSLEYWNTEMNKFIAKLITKLKDSGAKALLIKGQGVAQCYSRSLWRSCGDVDLFLDGANYQKAKSVLIPLASMSEEEDLSRLHLAMTIRSWIVELHGTMRTELSSRVDNGIDAVQKEIFEKGQARVWKNGDTEVLLPDPDSDIILIFTHFLKHLYVGGIGLRQICDWCRLIWTYRSRIDRGLLEGRLKAMGLMPEWRAFACLAVDYLEMPSDALPLYTDSLCHRRRARRVLKLILESGNFGHNKDESYRTRYPNLMGKVITFFRRFAEFVRLTTIFPGNAPRFFVRYVFGRVKDI